jgi:hypothetical protein
LEGWQAFANSLKSNKTLYNLPLPQVDISKAVSVAKDQERARERISEVMLQIKESLRTNYPFPSAIKGVGTAHELNPKFRETNEVSLLFNHTPKKKEMAGKKQN